MTECDVAIIGAGMAGASLAAAIAGRRRVVLIEAEDHPGRHATGRSAAFWSETYGGPMVQPLTSASHRWFAARGLLRPRGALYLAGADDQPAISAFLGDFAGSGVVLERHGRDFAAALLPRLDARWQHCIWEPSCADIDVAGAHQACLAEARRTGARLICGAPVEGAARLGGPAGGWRLETRAGPVTAGLVVNAAGAWADRVAALFGAPPIGITPYRRTVVQLRVAPPAPADLPLVLDMAGSFYFKPEAGGRLWLSPHDETRDRPHDVAPEELDVALAIDRFGAATGWPVEAVERRWAGLRSFAPDRAPVYGHDPLCPGLFWCAGQGGFGIQTAPAAADLAARLLLGDPAGPVDPAPYLPGRFARSA
ncbi:FAD-dependent oxidoreductase [Sphingomonas changnyeongensis]|uniref:FAD-dependent oxidoreductase n=1 Tax=Sphingomonas changnyeongensis TaxID=2698679 RepID=A0A7Z2NVZ2_9SPHN|nr:FAD-dependent oxidoreductase [Sphingomonas changnyeongensis]QHL90414.1 FAD-dependent oxidoreductase [Sphingomonas changnyeongensis]